MAAVPTFERELANHLDSLPRPGAKEKRLKRILELPRDNPRRIRVLRHLETSATTEMKLEAGSNGKIDWTEIDWGKLIGFLLKLLALL